MSAKFIHYTLQILFQNARTVYSALQDCPAGQNGFATWVCGTNGEWVGYPNMANCRKVDVGGAMAALNRTDSVPSEVVGTLRKEVSQEEDIASGDIESLLAVVTRAIQVTA
jgi:hypothetical protein